MAVTLWGQLWLEDREAGSQGARGFLTSCCAVRVYAASSVSVGQELGGRWPGRCWFGVPGGSSPRLGQGCCLLWVAGGSPPSFIPRPRAEDSGSLHRPVCRELRTGHWLPAVQSLGGGG